jgi:uncharacterized NAD(P)/FAD-binding protein YdhS
MANPSITVVGAGFSGTLLSLHLLRQCPAGTHIRLIERNRQFGPGQAYATDNPNHLLNVPAGRMSAFPDQPMHFLDWLHSRPMHELAGVMPDGGNFVPRRLFGRYIREQLHDALRNRASAHLELLHGSVSSIAQEPRNLRLHIEGGHDIATDIAVLALGNFTPEPIPVADSMFYDPALYCPDPWSPSAFAKLDRAAPVLLIGAGLTMVDAVISLLDQGHVGPIHAVSRRGLLPRCHTSAAVAPRGPIAYPSELRALTRFLREQAEQALAAGGTWQAVIDELRPVTQEIWATLSADDRRRFLRHLRTWWDVHRHRIATPVAARIEAARASGQLHVHAGRLRGYGNADGKMTVRFRLRGSDDVATLRVARVVNCSGPATDYGRVADPLVRSLLIEGIGRPDQSRLGLDVSKSCALRSRSGAESRRLFAVGPVTKGAFWEMTAVPDIRRQCEQLAQGLARLVVPASQPTTRQVVAHAVG